MSKNTMKNYLKVFALMLMGFGSGLFIHDINGHDYTFPVERIHGWMAGIASSFFGIMLLAGVRNG